MRENMKNRSKIHTQKKKVSTAVVTVLITALMLTACAADTSSDKGTQDGADISTEAGSETVSGADTDTSSDKSSQEDAKMNTEANNEYLDIMDPGIFDTPVPALRDAVCADMGDDFIMGSEATGPDIGDDKLMELIETHFNALTLGNELKPDSIFGYSNDRCPGTEETTLNGEKLTVPVTDFTRAEKYLNYIKEYNSSHPEAPISVRGHVLVWHSQTPEWFFHEDYDAKKPYVTPEEMNKRQEWYIKTVLEHFTGEGSEYADLFYGWDVVNEAVSDGTGTYRNADEGSSWWAVYQSNEFITGAFRYANKYAPADLKLYYNDYNETQTRKLNGILELLRAVKEADGTRIDGMGMQGHYNASDFTGTSFKLAAKQYGEIVDEVMLTELDLKSSSIYDGTDKTLNREYFLQAAKYRELYDAVKELKADGTNISGIVFWGAVDKYSWLQAFTGVGGGVTDGSPQCPLPFDDDYRPKPAFYAFADQTKLDRLIEINKQNMSR